MMWLLPDGLEGVPVVVHLGLLDEVLQRVLLPGQPLQTGSVQFQSLVLLLPFGDLLHSEVRTAIEFLKCVSEFVPNDDSDLEISEDGQLVRLLYQVPFPFVFLALSVHVVHFLGGGTDLDLIDRSFLFRFPLPFL